MWSQSEKTKGQSRREKKLTLVAHRNGVSVADLMPSSLSVDRVWQTSKK